jgi:diguanylate cyclase (GGDEF)-like protein/PAS domain S-box-containing protein
MEILKRKCVDKKVEEALQENLKFLQTVINTIPNPIFYKDSDGIYKHCNTAFLEYLDKEYEEVIGKGVHDIYPKELADIYYRADNELMNNKGKQIYEAKFMYKNHSLRDVIFNKATIKDKNDGASGLVGVIMDITERKLAAKNIERLLKMKDAAIAINQAIIATNNINELFNLVLDKISQVIDNAEFSCVLVLNEDKNLSVAACKGYDEEKSKSYFLNLKDTFLWIKTKGKLDNAIIINDIQEMLKDRFPNILENYRGAKIESSISAPIVVDGEVYGFVNVDSSSNHSFDEYDLDMMGYLSNQIAILISNHRLYKEIIYLSRYDKLTNVYNRSYFEELFGSYIKDAIINKKEFLLVLFDLNRLKFVNDNYGHLAGDKLIRVFSNSLSDLIGSEDYFARFGGDEFIAIFSTDEWEKTGKMFEDLIRDFRNNPIIFEQNNIICEFSYGIAKFPYDGKNYDQLVKIADERMYSYKKTIKNIQKFHQD